MNVNAINKIITEEVKNHNSYLRWKRQNVTIRGIAELGEENGGGGMLGSGLYTAALSNRQLARQYGKVYFLINAIPKNPKVFNTLNDWEIWYGNDLMKKWCDKNGVKYPNSNEFHKRTNIRDEMMKLGYDGIIIKGREMVNYSPPENVIYFEHEHQLQNYYYNTNVM